MSSSKKEWAIAGVCAAAFAGFVLTVASGTRSPNPEPVPAPSATTMRTAKQAPADTFPDCRDTAERPCVEWHEDAAWLVTETGARLPAIPVSRDESSRPRMITIR